MTNRTGRTIRRALAVLLGLGGVGIYATAQQPKPLIVKSAGPGVYTVDGPTPGNLLPATVMPGVPLQPSDATMMPVAPIAPVAARPDLLPGVPLPPVSTATVAAPAPLAPIPIPPAPPTSQTAVTPAGLDVPNAPQGPTAPVAPAAPAIPKPTPIVAQAPPVIVVPVAPTAPTAPTAPKVQKPRVVVEQTAGPLAPEMPVAPTQAPATSATPAPSAVLLAPVLAPTTPNTPNTLPGGGQASTPILPATPSPTVTQAPTPIIVLPTTRTPRTVVQAPVPTTPTPAPATQSPVVVTPPAVTAQVPVSTPVAISTAGPSCDKCGKCGRWKKHGDCCACAPATIPPPIGASVRTAFGTQRANALDEYCIIYREDFDQDTDTLNPTGERHIGGIARRLDQTRAPVKIEPTGNPVLDHRRTSTVIAALVKAGIPVEVAANRVQGGTSRAEGMASPDIEPTNVRSSLASYGYGYGANYTGFATFGPFVPYR